MGREGKWIKKQIEKNGDTAFAKEKGSRRWKGQEERDEKRINMCHACIPSPHNKCNHSVLLTCTNNILKHREECEKADTHLTLTIDLALYRKRWKRYAFLK